MVRFIQMKIYIYIGILIDSKNTENAKQALLYMIEK